VNPGHRPLLALLRSRARVADEISARLLRILDQADGIADEAKHRIRGSVASSVAEAAPYLRWRSIHHSLDSDYYFLRLTAALAALPVLFVSLLPEVREAGPTGLAAPVLHALTALDPQATDKIDRTERLLQRLS
jgi:hypothetical protein